MDRDGVVTTADALRRLRVSHDVRHGLATIAVLTETIGIAGGLDRDLAERVRSLRTEVRQLAALVEEELIMDEAPQPVAPIRVDVAARELVRSLQQATATRLEVATSPTQCTVGLTGLWRALRNLLDNAIRAASPSGRVWVRVLTHDGRAVVEVQDDGPGFGLAGRGRASLGLGIVADFVSRHDGTLEIGPGESGGCRVRISLPAPATVEVVGQQTEEVIDLTDACAGTGRPSTKEPR